MRRARRILLWTLGAAGVAVALGLGLTLYVAAHLESGMVKGPVTTAVRDALGVDLDYRAGSIGLFDGRVRLDGLHLGTPTPYAAAAPDVLTLARFRGRLDLWGALFGGGVEVGELDVEGVSITVVVGPHGNSLSALVPTSDEPPPEPSPWSHTLEDLQAALADVRFREIALDDVALTVVVVDEGGAVVGRSSLTPLSLHGLVDASASPWLHLSLTATDPEGARIATSSEGTRTAGPIEAGANAWSARVPLELGLEANRAEATLTVDAALADHGWSDLRRDPATIQGQVALATSPGKGRSVIRVPSLDLLGGILTVRDFEATLEDAEPTALDAIAGSAALRFEGPAPYDVSGVDARDVDLDLTLADASLSGAGFAGDASLSGTVGGAELDLAAGRVAADALAVDLRSTGSSGTADGGTVGVARLSLDARADRLEVRDAELGVDLVASGVTAGSSLDDFATGGRGLFGLHGVGQARLGVERLAGDTPVGGVEIDAGGLTVDADFDEGTVGVGFPAAALVLRGGGGAPWLDLRDAAIEARTDAPMGWSPGDPGGATGRFAGSIGAIAVAGSRGALPRIDVSLTRDEGTALYRVDARLGLDRVRGWGLDLSGRRSLRLDAQADLAASSARASLELTGGNGPNLTIQADLRVASGDVLTYRFSGDGTRLAELLQAVLPEGVEVDARRLALSAHGRLAGLVRRGAPNTVPRVVGGALSDLRGDQVVRVEVEDLGLALAGTDGDPPTSAKLPAVGVVARLDHAARDVGVALQADAGYAEADVAGVGRLKLRQVSQTLGFRWSTAPAPAEPLVLTSTTRVAAGELPDLLPGVPIGDATMSGELSVDAHATVARGWVLENPATRSTLSLEATYESALAPGAPEGTGQVVPGRLALVVEGALDQDVAALVATGLVREASGRLRVPFRVESGDLVAFQVTALPEAEQVTVADALGWVDVRGLDGVLPIVEDVAVFPDRIEIGLGTPTSTLTRARFFDVHPFLGGVDFVTADLVRLGNESFGPLAGNARLAGTVFAIDRLQTRYRGGAISGQLLVDARRGGAVSFRGSATGVRPGGDEDDGVLDVNGAFVFRPDTLALDGTVHVVRISRAHLREMLDVIDPFRESVSANRIRSLLGLGYPSFLRLRAEDGLLDVAIDLGGLAAAVRVDEIEAIPLAPLLEEYVGPTVDAIFAEPGTDEVPPVPEGGTP